MHPQVTSSHPSQAHTTWVAEAVNGEVSLAEPGLPLPHGRYFWWREGDMEPATGRFNFQALFPAFPYKVGSLLPLAHLRLPARRLSGYQSSLPPCPTCFELLGTAATASRLLPSLGDWGPSCGRPGSPALTWQSDPSRYPSLQAACLCRPCGRHLRTLRQINNRCTLSLKTNNFRARIITMMLE